MKAERPRVLLVPDSLYWAASGIAREIARHNPGFRFETQSEPVLRALLERLNDYPAYFDVVHFLLPHSASRLGHHFETRTAVVTTLHHIETERCTASLEGCDGIMVGTTQWRGELLELGLPEEKIVHVPYGVDTTVFRPGSRREGRRVRRELGLPPEGFVLGYCAKRSERKGVDVLLQGLRLLASQLPRATCLLMGPGWDSVVPEGLPCVRFPFTIDPHRVAEVYRALDVLWVTSRIEGGPFPVLEAMASGVPCISTRVGIPLDVVVDGENGFLVPFDDPEAFCRLTLRLAGDPRLQARMAAGARAVAVRDCQWSQTVPRAAELYELSLARFEARAERDGLAGTRSRSGEDLPLGWRRWIAGREHHLYSKFLLTRREYEPAAELAMRALRASPRDPKLWLHAGDAKLEQALRALRLNPRDLKPWLRRQRLKLRDAT